MTVKTLPLGNLGANFYIVKDELTNDIFVVDPGDEAAYAIEKIEELQGNLRYIILTHAHADHIGALDDIKTAFGSQVVIHEYEAMGLNNPNINLSLFIGSDSPVTKADICVKDGDTLPFGKSEIKFIHTPGHTVGSMCILYNDSLFSGDTLFELSIGRTDFPGGN